MRISAQDVAKACDLPVSTVYSVLYDKIGGEDRKKVLEAAEKLGLALDGQAKKSHNLGILFRDESGRGLQHAFFASIVNAFKEEAEASGYDITFISGNIGGQKLPCLDHCRCRQVDGVALICVPFDDPDIQSLIASDIPCVTIDYLVENQPAVLADNKSGLKMLVDYAASLGHRRIAYIHGQRNSLVTETRIEQFIQAMRDHQLPLPKEYLVEGRYDDAGLIHQLVTGLLELPSRPTCILLPDDASYFGAKEAIGDMEMRIPSDVSVAGYDGTRLMESVRPRLTTIRQDGKAMGKEAADRLIWQVEHPERPINAPVVVPVTLIKGDTVGWCNVW